MIRVITRASITLYGIILTNVYYVISDIFHHQILFLLK